MNKLGAQTQQSLEFGREDLARMALERKQVTLEELEGLDQQIAGLEVEQEKLTFAEQRLQTKVAAFRTRKEIIKAQYTAAQAQVRIGSTLSGLSEEIGDISLAVERAENKTEMLRAKSGAIDELAASDILTRSVGSTEDDIDRQLRQASKNVSVESELASIKADIKTDKANAHPEDNS